MATRNQLLRLIVIDEALRSGREYHSSDLARMCMERYSGENLRKLYGSDDENSYSERTIRSDIRLMREKFQAPIPKRNPGQVYKYTEAGFSLFRNPLFAGEAQTLRLAAQILNQFKGLPLGEELNRFADDTTPSDLPGLESPNVIIETAPVTEANQWLGALFEAITERHPLQLHYHPFTKDPITIDIHPLQLKLFNRRWFLYGEPKETPRTVMVYPLDRITALIRPEGEKPFNFPPSFLNYSEFLYGISPPHGGMPTTIRAALKKPRAYYLKSKPIHPCQIVVSETDDDITFAWKLYVNNELVAELIHYLEDLQIIEPPELQERLALIGENFLKKNS